MADKTISMGDLNYKAQKSEVGAWGGTTSENAQRIYQQVYGVGTLAKCLFGITLTPYKPDGALAELTTSLYNASDLNTLLQYGKGTKDKQPVPLVDDNFNEVLPLLCASLDITFLEAQTESFTVGHHQLNYITGNSSESITLNLIETRNGSILNSAKAIKSLMFPQDGTQLVPAEYLMILNIFIYDRHSKSRHVFTLDYLVALQTASLSLEVEERNGVSIVPLTFLKMFPNVAF